MATRKPPALNRADQAFQQGLAMLRQHPMFEGLLRRASVRRDRQHTQVPAQGWLVAYTPDLLYLHPTRVAEPGEWAFVVAHGLLYFGMERFEKDRAIWPAWSAACDVVIVRLLRTLKLGQVPASVQARLPEELPGWDEARWYAAFAENGVPDWAAALSPAGPAHTGMQSPADHDPHAGYLHPSRLTGWSAALADGISRSVQQAVQAASGQGRPRLQGPRPLSLPTERARSWFIGSFPLLGAMVSAFEFIEDADLCRREEVQVAAVDEVARTVYLNPAAGLTELERRFVIAHEVLHVSLRHLGRRRGRDAYLWNVACDYVINGWLIEIGIGTPPALGLLHDPQLAGLSAEEVYDRIVTDLRRARKLLTLAGRQGDMLERRLGSGPVPGEGTDLDAFYRSMLTRGLALHDQQGRGLLPAGLIEEIRALLQPPIPWDVKLAQWFDHHFPPIERQRSYARPSRRQASTPDIPRARWVVDPRWLEGRTFGVVLDTSGSMDRHLLARALGAIASYAAARDVPAARVVFCDAAAHDAGYMPADEIAGRVAVRGRGGTVLQPGIDLLQDTRDFPADGPILVITDGGCDTLAIRRSHAFLLPEGRRLPFRPVGEVFYLS